MLSAILGEYKLPSMQDVPELRTVFVDTETEPSPFSGKAVAESALSPISAAIAKPTPAGIWTHLTHRTAAP